MDRIPADGGLLNKIKSVALPQDISTVTHGGGGGGAGVLVGAGLPGGGGGGGAAEGGALVGGFGTLGADDLFAIPGMAGGFAMLGIDAIRVIRKRTFSTPNKERTRHD